MKKNRGLQSSDAIQSNPIRGWIQSMSNSATTYIILWFIISISNRLNRYNVYRGTYLTINKTTVESAENKQLQCINYFRIV